MARSWLTNGGAIAKKVKNATRSSAHLIKDFGENLECPNCHHRIDISDVCQDWPGLPAGVKFDPSDVELLDHLAAKCGVGNCKPHIYIDEFIPSLDGDQGICYAHPGKLPGTKKDGSSVHFFHKTKNAYASGQRKRRKIHNENSSSEEQVRWHKTGKTKPVMDKGVQKGCKKIMVLYKSSKKGSKPYKSNWVMHQYHLGTNEDEKAGEYVVSKIFYQQQKNNDKDDDDSPVTEVSDSFALQPTPRTPNPNPPHPPRAGKGIMCDDVADANIPQLSVLKQEHIEEASHVSASASIQLEEDAGYLAWLAGESQAVDSPDFSRLDSSLLCKEILHSPSLLPSNSEISHASYTGIARNTNEVPRNNDAPCSIGDLANLEFDTPPDFQLADLQFGSQDSILDWMDWP